MTVSLLLFAAALQIVLVAAIPVLVRMLRMWHEHAQRSPIVRQIHRVQHAYIAGLLRVLAVVLTLFRGIRPAVQRIYYDRDDLRSHRRGDVCFSAIFAALFGITAAAAAGGLR